MLVTRVASGLRGPDKIDNLLDQLSRSTQHVRDCAESVMDQTIVGMHHMVRSSHQATEDIHTATRNTADGMDEIRTQMQEVLRQTQSLQSCIDAINGKNGVFQFFMEVLNSTYCRRPHRGTVDLLVVSSC